MPNRPTPDGKRVRSTLIVFPSERIETLTARLMSTIPVFLAEDNLRIVGWEIECQAMPDVPDYAPDSGHVTVDARLGKGPAGQYTGWIGHAHSFMIGTQVTVGVSNTQVIVPRGWDMQIMMFAEGYGVDLDEAEFLILSVYAENTMANDHWVKAGANVFWVER